MIRRLLPAIILLSLCLFAAPRPVAAFNFFGGVDCSQYSANRAVDKPTVCKSQAVDAHGNPVNPLTGPDGILAGITNVVAWVAGAAAVIIIIISALKFITSGSSTSTGSRTDTDVEDARRSLGNAVIGLVVIVLARTLILYIVKRL
jgi:hypothetical protein